MGCNCKGVSLLCSTRELAECASRACDEGRTLNNWWQTRVDAEKCAQRWTAKTGMPHYIAEATSVADEAPVSRMDYSLVSCPQEKVYDAWLRTNGAEAKSCADRWNDVAQSKGSPMRYEAKRLVSRFLFADIWRVVVKK